MADRLDNALFGHLTSEPNGWLSQVDLRPEFPVEIAISGTDADRFMGFAAAKESLAWLRAHELEA